MADKDVIFELETGDGFGLILESGHVRTCPGVSATWDAYGVTLKIEGPGEDHGIVSATVALYMPRDGLHFPEIAPD